MAKTLKHQPIAGDDYLALIRRLPLAPIRDVDGLGEAWRMIDELTRVPESELSAGQADYLAVLGDLARTYELERMGGAEHRDGRGILIHLLEANGMSGSDLGRLLGQRELGSKILRGTRAISRAHAKVLGGHFGIPAETFLR